MSFWTWLTGGEGEKEKARPRPAPKIGPDIVTRAELLVAEKKPREAQALLEKAVAEIPPGWKARTETETEVKIAFWNQGEFLAFCAALPPDEKRKQIWVGPPYSKVHYYLAFLAVERRDYHAAVAHIEAGLAVDPDHPLLWSELGMIHSGAKRHEKALEAFRKASSCRSWDKAIKARAIRGAGVALIDLGRLDEAEAAFHGSLELEPGNKVALHELKIIGDARKSARPPGTIGSEVKRTMGPGL